MRSFSWWLAFAVAVGSVMHAHAADVKRGSLIFQPCSIGQSETALGTQPAWCTSVTVLERRDRPQGRRIDLRVAILPSRSASPEPDPVLFLAGGPGQAATEAYPALSGVFEAFRRKRDILLIDQRGTGGSHPLLCSSPQDKAMEDNAENRQKASQTCLTEVQKNADPAGYTTTESVADLAEVWAQWGAPQLNIIGVSYGTRLAQKFAQAHPAAMRSLVLDSAVPNDAPLGAETGTNLDRALTARWDLCKNTPACAEKWKDPFASLRALEADVRKAPRTVTFRDPRTFKERQGTLTGDRLEDTVRLAAYAPETASLMAWWVGEALAGDASALMAQGAMAEEEIDALSRNVLQLSVLCSEDALTGQASQAEKESLLGTRPREALKAQCGVWPRGAVPVDFHAPFKSDLPALVLQGEWDPATPPHYGRQVVEGLSNGRLILAKGQGHNVVVRGCMPKLVADFLEDPKAKLETACVDRLGPQPDVLSVQGASP